MSVIKSMMQQIVQVLVKAVRPLTSNRYPPNRSKQSGVDTPMKDCQGQDSFRNHNPKHKNALVKVIELKVWIFYHFLAEKTETRDMRDVGETDSSRF